MKKINLYFTYLTRLASYRGLRTGVQNHPHPCLKPHWPFSGPAWVSISRALIHQGCWPIEKATRHLGASIILRESHVTSKPRAGEPRPYLVLHQRGEVCSWCAEKKQKNQGKPSGASVVRRVLFLVLSVRYKGLKVRLQFSSLQRGPMFP